MPGWVLDKLGKEWVVIAQAPITLTFITLLVVALVYLYMRHQYRDQVEGLRNLVGLYRDRFGPVVGESKSPVAQLRNSTLHERAINLVGAMRDIAEECRRATDIDLEQPFEIRDRMTRSASEQFRSRYERECRSEALMLREEIIERLKTLRIKANEARAGMVHSYESPTNPIGLNAVADDLERLAKTLP
jgi:hypothetical protein